MVGRLLLFNAKSTGLLEIVTRYVDSRISGYPELHLVLETVRDN